MKRNRLFLLGMLFVMFSLVSCDNDNDVISSAGGGGGTTNNIDDERIELSDGMYVLSDMMVVSNGVEATFEDFYKDLPSDKLKEKEEMKKAFLDNATVSVSENLVQFKYPEKKGEQYLIMEANYSRENFKFEFDKDNRLVLFHIPKSSEDLVGYNLYFTYGNKVFDVFE